MVNLVLYTILCISFIWMNVERKKRIGILDFYSKKHPWKYRKDNYCFEWCSGIKIILGTDSPNHNKLAKYLWQVHGIRKMRISKSKVYFFFLLMNYEIVQQKHTKKVQHRDTPKIYFIYFKPLYGWGATICYIYSTVTVYFVRQVLVIICSIKNFCKPLNSDYIIICISWTKERPSV